MSVKEGVFGIIIAKPMGVNIFFVFLLHKTILK